MNQVYQIMTITLLSIALQSFLPWWSAAVAAALPSFVFHERSLRSFVFGFIGVGIVWLVYALWLDIGNNSLLSNKISKLLGLKHPAYLLLLTALLGGITGGLGAWTGSELRKWFTR